MTKWRTPSTWKLMLTTLPIVAFVLGLRVLAQRGFGYNGSVEFSDVTAVFTAVAFLIGFMLAGTMSDYKEAEKVPGDMAAALEAVEESLSLAAIRKGLDVAAVRRKVMETTSTVCDYMLRKRTVAEAYQSLTALEPVLEEADKAGATPYVSRASTELGNVRKAITRVDVISNTGFLAPGYALLDVMVVATVILLLMTKFKNELVEYVLVTFITLLYVYMLRLIRDIDNPFELSRMGSAEVDPAPLMAYRERAADRLAKTPASAAKAAVAS